MSKNTEASHQYTPDQELSCDPREAVGSISVTKGDRGQGDCSFVMSTGQLGWVWALIPFSTAHWRIFGSSFKWCAATLSPGIQSNYKGEITPIRRKRNNLRLSQILFSLPFLFQPFLGYFCSVKRQIFMLYYFIKYIKQGNWIHKNALWKVQMPWKWREH